MNIASRIDSLRRRMVAEQAGAALITTNATLKYLTGFVGVIDHGIHAACLVTPDSARFYTDSRYIEAARDEAASGPWDVRLQQTDLYRELCEELETEGVTSLLVESEVPHSLFALLTRQFRGEVRVADGIGPTLREIKEPAEVECIAAAAAIADRGFEYICGLLKPGVTEHEIALELEFWMRRNGSEEMPFEPIIAFGPNAARPHAMPGARQLATGDLVVLDFGAKVGGYCSDMTRTVAIGEISAEKRALYDAVLAANLAGLAAVGPGVACFDVDRASRDVLTAAGLGDLFTHGVGHGVGLEVHELPRLSKIAKTDLAPGAVVTVEPGVYVAGVAGVRIEDLVVVSESGYRQLTNAPKDLIQL